MMNELILAGLLGGVGGLTRGVVGLLKAWLLKGKFYGVIGLLQ